MQLNFPRCNIGWLRVSIFFCLHPPIPQLSQLFLCVKHFQSSKGVREKRELFQPQCYTYSIQVERHRHNQKQKWLWIFNQIPFRGSSKFYRVNLPLRTGSLLNEHRSQENLPHFSPRSTKMCSKHIPLRSGNTATTAKIWAGNNCSIPDYSKDFIAIATPPYSLRFCGKWATTP